MRYPISAVLALVLVVAALAVSPPTTTQNVDTTIAVADVVRADAPIPVLSPDLFVAETSPEITVGVVDVTRARTVDAPTPERRHNYRPPSYRGAVDLTRRDEGRPPTRL